MKALVDRGGVVCGTSAGAAALTELTMAGGEIDEEGNLVEQYIGPGFGLLGFETIIDTHFSTAPPPAPAVRRRSPAIPSSWASASTRTRR